jgi:hypothetical protein
LFKIQNYLILIKESANNMFDQTVVVVYSFNTIIIVRKLLILGGESF